MITIKHLENNAKSCEFDCLIGEYIENVQLVEGEGYIFEVILYFRSGKKLRLYHDQDCCERVALIDIVGGSLDDLVGQEIKSFKSVSSKEMGEGCRGEYDYSNTWTFITISTFKDDITLRWHGGSNGFYSERVDFDFYDENGNYVCEVREIIEQEF